MDSIVKDVLKELLRQLEAELRYRACSETDHAYIALQTAADAVQGLDIDQIERRVFEGIKALDEAEMLEGIKALDEAEMLEGIKSLKEPVQDGTDEDVYGDWRKK